MEWAGFAPLRTAKQPNDTVKDKTAGVTGAIAEVSTCHSCVNYLTSKWHSPFTLTSTYLFHETNAALGNLLADPSKILSEILSKIHVTRFLSHESRDKV